MKLLKRSIALLMASLLLMGAAPPAPNGEGENAPPPKVEEPRDQKEKIHTAKGVLPMTATEKKAFDEAMAKPEAALSLIHISEPTRLHKVSRMPSSA